MYPSYDDMFKFHNSAEAEDFVEQRMLKMASIIDEYASEIFIPETVDESRRLHYNLERFASRIGDLIDLQLEEADSMMCEDTEPSPFD